MPAATSTIDYTDQKFRFARVHLDELLMNPNRYSGDDWERGHEESVLFHLVGAVEGTFQEMNSAFGLGLNLEEVNLKTLKEEAKKNSALLASLGVYQNERDKADGWLERLYALRNWGAHRGPARRVINVGSVAATANNFVHPISGAAVPGGTTDVLSDLETKARDLVQRIRAKYP